MQEVDCCLVMASPCTLRRAQHRHGTCGKSQYDRMLAHVRLYTAKLCWHRMICRDSGSGHGMLAHLLRMQTLAPNLIESWVKFHGGCHDSMARCGLSGRIFCLIATRDATMARCLPSSCFSRDLQTSDVRVARSGQGFASRPQMMVYPAFLPFITTTTRILNLCKDSILRPLP